MWYRTAAEKHPWLNYPLSKDVPEGSVRRLHYTSDDDVLLDQIKQQGLLVDRSKGHAHGDPRAIFSNPATEQLSREFQEKPLVEFHTPADNIIGDQYSYADITPDQILGLYPSWYSKLIYLVEKRGIDGAINFLKDNDLIKNGIYAKVYEYLLKMDWLQRHNVQSENGKFIFYHGTRANLPDSILRAKSLLETTPEEAQKWGDTNNMNERRKRVNVYKVIVDLFDFETGYWATTNKDLRVTKVG